MNDLCDLSMLLVRLTMLLITLLDGDGAKVFEYNSQFHNVMQVSHLDFKSCNVSFPLASYISGNDSITIKKYGHYYFLCGVPGHCQAGQKVDIRIPRASTSKTTAPTPSELPSPSPPPPPTAAGAVALPPSTTKNSAPTTSSSYFMGFLLLLLGNLELVMTCV